MVRTLAENPRLIAPRIGLGCVTWCHLLGFRQKRQETISVGHATLVIICRSHIGVLRLIVGQIYRQITIDQF